MKRAASRSLDLLRFFALKPKAMFAVPAIRRIRGYTMQTIAGAFQMQDHIALLDRARVAGAVVETGCWRGGLGAFMARFGREVWLFDSFEGLPEMTEKDADLAGPKGLALHEKTGYIAVDESNARRIAAKLGVHPHIVKGWFSDTLPANKRAIGPIAILRLDGDTYDSTLQALEALYPQVVAGGIVVIDDYFDFEGCREAVYDFFRAQGIAPAIQRYPYGRAYFRKA